MQAAAKQDDHIPTSVVGFALAKAGGVEKESRFAWYRQPLSQTFGLPALPAAQGHSGWNRSPYSLPFVILPVPARSPFRFIRHRRRSTPNLSEGAFWCSIVSYMNTGTVFRPLIFTISHVHPPQGGFHMAQPYFTLRRQYFTAGVSPLISFPLQPRWLRRGSR